MKVEVGSKHGFSIDQSLEADPTATARIDRYDPEKLIAELKRELRGGMRLGRYIVIEHVGAGGAGIVYRAYDSKLRREVALKQLRTGVLDARSEARLLREAQAMAQLSHPNVISVFDVESTKNGLVLAMEYVDGETLRSWIRKNRSWKEILDIFIQAGEGLAEAHRVGLIHRDFKPTNVLVSEGRARVMDFGLARLAMLERTAAESGRPTGSVGAADSLDSLGVPLTTHGMLMGTPVYMAPEQHRGESLDARTDQFSFCVALWEALCSVRPFKGNLALLEEAKEAGPPAWPKSVRVPAWLSTAVIRGLEPDRRRRWPSMEALLEHLQGRSDRHRSSLTVGAAVGMIAAGVPAAWAWQAYAAGECSGARSQIAEVWSEEVQLEVATALVAVGQGHGEESWHRVEQRIDGWVEAWVGGRQDTCEATTVRGEQSALVMDRRIACLDRAKRQLEFVTAVLTDLDKKSALEAVDLVDGLPSLDHCADVDALLADIPEPSNPQLAAEVSRRRDVLARAQTLQVAGRGQEAWSVLEDALEGVESLNFPVLHAETWYVAGQIESERGHYERSEEFLRRAYRLAVELDHADMAYRSAVALVHVAGHQSIRIPEGMVWADSAVGLGRRVGPHGLEEALALTALGSVHARAGRYDDAVSRLSEALAIFESQPPAAQVRMGATLNTLGETLYRKGEYGQAATMLQRSADLIAEHYGRRHPNVSGVYDNLGAVHSARGELDEALEVRQRALDVREAALGRLHPSTGISFHNVANVHFRLGLYDEAAEGYRRALLAWKSSLGDEHPHVASCIHNLGNVALARGRLDEAQQRYREALESRTKRLGDAHPDVANSLHMLGVAAFERGTLSEARTFLESALKIRRSALGDEHGDVADAMVSLARVALEQGRLGEADELARRASKMREHSVPLELRYPVELALGLVAETRGDLAAASKHLERARELGQDLRTTVRADLSFAIGRVAWLVGENREEARAEVVGARALLEDPPFSDSRRLTEIQAWLDAHPP